MMRAGQRLQAGRPRHGGLVVADFTGHRGGVYFEAGFARGLGIPVVWTCHKEYDDSPSERQHV